MKRFLVSILFLTCFWSVSCHKEPISPVNLNEVLVTTVFPIKTGYMDGPVGQAAAQSITAWAFDASDNLYFTDAFDNRIRKITPDGIVSTVAGTGVAGFVDGASGKAQFYYPNALAFDSQGNLYVAQIYAIRKITPSGEVSTVLGANTPGIQTRSFANGDTIRYPVIDGAPLFDFPTSLAFDNSGNLYVVNGANTPRIVKLTSNHQPGLYYGTPFSTQDGTIPGTNALVAPSQLLFDAQTNAFIIDSGIGIIKLNPNGQKTAFTGDGYVGHVDGPGNVAEFSSVRGAAFDKAGNLYVGDDTYIRKITPDGTVSTIAGSGNNSRTNTELLKDGVSSQAQISNPRLLAFDSKGNLFVYDDGGIRKITFP